MADLGELLRRRRADLAIGGIGASELGKRSLERGVTPALGIVLGVGNGRRVLAVVAPVMLGDLGLKPRVLFPRLGKGEFGRFRLFRHGLKLAQRGGWWKAAGLTGGYPFCPMIGDGETAVRGDRAS